MSKPRTLFDKIWDAHLVDVQDDGTSLLYIDRHMVHEVTSPQAFDGLRANDRKVRRPDLTLAVADHNIQTTARVDAAGKRLPESRSSASTAKGTSSTSSGCSTPTPLRRCAAVTPTR